MNRITQLQHWKICRFWNRHKLLHRLCIVFIVAPVCVIFAFPAAAIGFYEDVRDSLWWLKDLWRKSDKPYDKWIAETEED